MKKVALVVCLMFMAFMMSACGGGGGSDPDTNPQVLSGQFVDAPVEGLSYTSGTTTGKTTENGIFKYESGKTVTFKVGDIVLGTSQGKAIVTPLDLARYAKNDQNIPANDQMVVNMVRFLMTVTGSNTSSQIFTITSTTNNNCIGKTVNFDQSTGAFTIPNSITANSLTSAVDAENHFNNTLSDLNGGSDLNFSPDEIIAKFNFDDNVLNLMDNTKRITSADGNINYWEWYFNSKHLELYNTHYYIISEEGYYTDKVSISFLSDDININLSNYVSINANYNNAKVEIGSLLNPLTTYVTSETNYGFGPLHHFVINIDNSIGSQEVVQVYVDGIKRNITITSPYILSPGEKFPISTMLIDGDKDYPPVLDELILKNGVFTEQEIVQMYESYFMLDTTMDDISFKSINGGVPTSYGAPTFNFPIFNNSITGSSLNYSATCDKSWVTINPSSGSLLAGKTTNLTISTDAAGLPVGTYEAKMIISSPGQIGRIARITLVVSSTP